MSFPSPTAPVPGLTVGQLSFRGVTFGGVAQGAAYTVQKIEGMDQPSAISGDIQRALENGEFAGPDTLPGRDVVVVQVVRADPALGANAGKVLAENRLALAACMVPGGVVEEPLWLRTELGTYGCMARPRRHNFPWDVSAFVAKGVVVTSMWHATDPRWYAAPSVSSTAGLVSSVGGLSFGGPGSGVSFGGPGSGVSFGGGREGATVSVVNAGPVEVRPVLVIAGPCTNPKVANLSVAGSPQVGFEITLREGETLVVGMDFQTVQLQTSPGGPFASRANLVVPGSVWWGLPPASTSSIVMHTSDTGAVAGTLTVESASGYLSI